MKILAKNYTFSPSLNKVVLDGNISANQLLLITNISLNVSIYVFNNAGLGLKSLNYDSTVDQTTFELNYDCSEMLTTDVLQIFYEADEAAEVKLNDKFLDSSNKVKTVNYKPVMVSNFDKDIEPEKWETLEGVSGTPTHYKKDPGISIQVASINITEGSDIAVITLGKNLPIFLTNGPIQESDGYAIIIENSLSNLTNGTFYAKTTAIVGSNRTITIQLSSPATQTANVATFATKMYEASRYVLSNLYTSEITTDGADQSLLTMKTRHSTNLSVGTSILLSNVCLNKSVPVVADTLKTDPVFTAIGSPVTFTTPTGESDKNLYTACQPYVWESYPEDTLYFTSADITVASNQLTFSTPHGLVDNQPYIYDPGIGNTPINLIGQQTFLYVRVVSATVCYFATAKNSTTKILITSVGTNGGFTKQRLIKAYSLNVTQTANTKPNTPILLAETPSGWNTGDCLQFMFSNTASNSPVFSSGYDTVYNYRRQTSATALAPKVTNISGNTIYVDAAYISSAAVTPFVVFRIKKNVISYYLPNHGLNVGDYVFISNTITTEIGNGTVTGQLNGVLTQVETIISANRVSFSSNIQVTKNVNINPYATAAIPISIPTTYQIYKVNFSSDTTKVINTFNISPSLKIPNGSFGYYKELGLFITNLATSGQILLSETLTCYKNTLTTSYTANGAIAITTTTTHGLTTGDQILLPDWKTKGFYTKLYVNVKSNTSFSAHYTLDHAVNNIFPIRLTDTTIYVSSLYSPTNSDLTSSDITLRLNESYTSKISKVINSNTYEMQTPIKINKLEITINPKKNFIVSQNIIYFQNHGLMTGQPISYKSGQNSTTDLTADQTYYVIVINEYSFKLTDTLENAYNNISNITLTDNNNIDIIFNSDSITGLFLGKGSLVGNNGILTPTFYSGTGQNSHAKCYYDEGGKFISEYHIGDQLLVSGVSGSAYTEYFYSVTSVNTTTNELTVSENSFLSTGIKPIFNVNLTNLVPKGIYYIKVVSTTDKVFKLYHNHTDASNGVNFITLAANITGTFRVIEINNAMQSLGNVIGILADSSVGFSSVSTVTTSVAKYLLQSIGSIRSNSQNVLNPKTSEVEMQLGLTKNSSLVRQSRIYFRTDIDKSTLIQTKFNFSPSINIDDFYIVTGSTAKIVTKFPHNLSIGSTIVVSGDESGDYNGEFTVVSILDELNFVVQVTKTPASNYADGDLKYYVKSWTGVYSKVGLFDDQKGIYLEYFNNEFSIVNRKLKNVSGSVSILSNSADVIGTNTRFTSQLNINDSIVINDMVFKVVNIQSDTQLSIAPKYLGANISNARINKVVEIVTPQSLWNIDKCDGTTQSGFKLNYYDINTLYIDISVTTNKVVKIGFKNSSGDIIFAHSIITDFVKLPLRYEIENTNTPSYSVKLNQGTCSILSDVFNTSTNNIMKNNILEQSTSTTHIKSCTMTACIDPNGLCGPLGSTEHINRNILKLNSVYPNTTFLTVDNHRTIIADNVVYYPDNNTSGLKFIKEACYSNIASGNYKTLTTTEKQNIENVFVSNSIIPGDYAYPNGFGKIQIGINTPSSGFISYSEEFEIIS